MIFTKKEKDPEKLNNLEEAINYIKILEKKIDALDKRIEKDEKIALNNFSKFSILRFNSFNDMGGDQSFTIALLDKNNNGFILTSLFYKDSPRVFTKPIKNGISEYQLLKEEETILKQALDDKKTGK